MTQELDLEEALFTRVSEIIETAKGQVARTVNTAMLHAYWFIGREIVEVEQEGKGRAKYGEEVIKKLSKRLTGQFGKGFSVPTLKRMRQFYQAFPEGSLLPEKMGGPQKGSTLLSEFQESNEGNALATKSTNGKTPLFPGLSENWSAR
jgi:hypothetical protein